MNNMGLPADGAGRDSTDSLLARAIAAHQRGNLDRAAKLFKRLLKHTPGHGPALHGLGLIARARGDALRALRYLARAAASTVPGPPSAEVLANYAAMLGNAGKHAKALTQAERAVAADPKYAPGHHTRAVALEKLGRRGEAQAAYRAAIALDAGLAPALAGLGALLLDRGGKRWEASAAREKQDGALVENPEPRLAAGADSGRVRPPYGQEPRAEALRLLSEAHRLALEDVDVADKLGCALRLNQQFSAAVGVYRKIVEKRPGAVGARSNLAVALQESGDIDGAISQLEEVLRIKHDYAEGRWNLALALLLRGHTPAKAQADDLRRGWLEFEWRRRLPTDKLEKTRPPHPEWDGRDARGLRVLLRAEQGLGDTLQFIRYARDLKARGAAEIIVECQPPLAALLARAAGVDRAIERGRALPPFDLQARLMTLPGILERYQTVEESAPYIEPDPGRSALWRDRLAALAGFKIGIAWQGNPKYVADAWRSIPLAEFAPLARVPGVRLISLQQDRVSNFWNEAQTVSHSLASPARLIPHQIKKPSRIRSRTVRIFNVPAALSPGGGVEQSKITWRLSCPSWLCHQRRRRQSWWRCRCSG